MSEMLTLYRWRVLNTLRARTSRSEAAQYTRRQLRVASRESIHHLLLGGDLVAHAVVLLLHLLDLLLQVLHVTILGSELVLELTNLTGATNLLERGALLGACLSLVVLELLLEAEGVENHNVGAVEDEREEQGKSAQVHVALRVELAGLDLHALDATKTGLPGGSISQCCVSEIFVNLPSLRVVAEAGELNLNSVDAVDAVYEEDEDEDERYLHFELDASATVRFNATYLHAIL